MSDEEYRENIAQTVERIVQERNFRQDIDVDDRKAVIVPEGWELKPLEHWRPHPDRAKGSVILSRLEGLTRYVSENDAQQA